MNLLLFLSVFFIFSVLLNEFRMIHRGHGSLVLAGVTDYRGG